MIDKIKQDIADVKAAMERAVIDFDNKATHQLAILKQQIEAEKTVELLRWSEIMQNLHNDLNKLQGVVGQ